LRWEFAKVEGKLQTLYRVLSAKEKKHLAEVVWQHGISSLQEFEQNITKGWQDVTAPSACKKPPETSSQAGHRASAAFSLDGSVIKKKKKKKKLKMRKKKRKEKEKKGKRKTSLS
jgi:hypothetical protein